MLRRATFQKQKPRLILSVLILADQPVLALELKGSGWMVISSVRLVHIETVHVWLSPSLCGLQILLSALPTPMLSPLRSHSWPSWTQCCAHLLLGLSSWQLWLYCKSPLCYWALFLCPEGLGALILVPGKFNVLLTGLTSLTSSQEGSRLGSNSSGVERGVWGYKTWWSTLGAGALLKVFFFC